MCFITSGKVFVPLQVQYTGADWFWQQDELVCKHAEPVITLVNPGYEPINGETNYALAA